jgi:hypothetical protein
MVPAMAQGTWELARKMEPGMVHPHRDRSSFFSYGRAALAALLLLSGCALMLPFEMPAEAAEKDKVLEESGIRYPEGFDLNTVGRIQGKVFGFFEPENGPVRFYLSSKRETYTVIISPKWYWNDLGVKITDGEEVSVLGSKSLGKDNNLYIIAQEIRLLNTGQSLVFRGSNGSPLWKGPRIGAQGGLGSPLRSRGGVGGMGRGGRR